MARKHKHLWVFASLTVLRPKIASPRLEIVYECAGCPGTRTVRLTPRLPNPDALTDEERFQRKADRNLARYRAAWGDEATDRMVEDGIRPVVGEQELGR